MSCTVTALPLALMYLIPIIVGGTITAAEENINNSYRRDYLKTSNFDFNTDISSIIKEDTPQIQMAETSYQTAFTDASLLMKTLKEHGIENFEVNNDEIRCKVQDYTLSFTRKSQEEAFNLNIICPEHCNANEKINDLNQEYTLNVQEESYLSIINKLQENNMSLESEEVLDDNTIVLTINVE